MFNREPWHRPSIAHKARKEKFGGTLTAFPKDTPVEKLGLKDALEKIRGLL